VWLSDGDGKRLRGDALQRMENRRHSSRGCLIVAVLQVSPPHRVAWLALDGDSRVQRGRGGNGAY
jgi:hypothetical protein